MSEIERQRGFKEAALERVSKRYVAGEIDFSFFKREVDSILGIRDTTEGVEIALPSLGAEYWVQPADGSPGYALRYRGGGDNDYEIIAGRGKPC